MKNLKEYNVQDLNIIELKETQGGILMIIAAVCGIVYLVGEMAYMKGRVDGGCDQ